MKMNRCSICGKYRCWDDLTNFFVPDTHFCSEDEWFECNECQLKQKIKEDKENV